MVPRYTFACVHVFVLRCLSIRRIAAISSAREPNGPKAFTPTWQIDKPSLNKKIKKICDQHSLLLFCVSQLLQCMYMYCTCISYQSTPFPFFQHPTKKRPAGGLWIRGWSGFIPFQLARRPAARRGLGRERQRPVQDCQRREDGMHLMGIAGGILEGRSSHQRYFVQEGKIFCFESEEGNDLSKVANDRSMGYFSEKLAHMFWKLRGVSVYFV